VDTVNNVATIAAGNRLGTVIQSLLYNNRAASHGFCLSVGVGGHVGTSPFFPQLDSFTD
jgi:hypothetical protein